VWNKVDLVPDRLSYLEQEASRRESVTVPVSTTTGAGIENLIGALQAAFEEDMVPCSMELPYGDPPMLSALHSLAVLDEIHYGDQHVCMRGRVPDFLYDQLASYKGVRLFNDAGELVAGEPTAAEKDWNDSAINLWLTANGMADEDEDVQIAAWLQHEEQRTAQLEQARGRIRDTQKREEQKADRGERLEEGSLDLSDETDSMSRASKSGTEGHGKLAKKIKGKGKVKTQLAFDLSEELLSTLCDEEDEIQLELDFEAMAKRRPRGLRGKRAREDKTRASVWLGRSLVSPLAAQAAQAAQAAVDAEMTHGGQRGSAVGEVAGTAEVTVEPAVSEMEVLDEDMDGQWVPDW